MGPVWLQYGMFWVTAAVALVSLSAAAVSYYLFRAHVDPTVIVYAKHDYDRPSLLVIVIENIGKGVAHDVRFTLSRPIPRKAFRIDKTGAKEFDQMSDGPLITGIAFLAPGENRIITWGQLGGLIDSIGTEPVRVTASYQSKSAFPWDPSDHSTVSLLEVSSFEATDASERPELRQVRELAKISQAIESSGRSVLEAGSVIAKRLDAVAERVATPETSESVPPTQTPGDSTDSLSALVSGPVD